MGWFTPAGVAAVGSALTGIGGVTGALFPTSGVNQHKKKEKRLLAANIDATEQNTVLQRRAYYHGIEDRVQDAIAAGVHPLFALGANLSSYGAASGSGISYPYKDSGPGRLASGLREAGIALQDFAQAQARSAEATAEANEIGVDILRAGAPNIVADMTDQPTSAVVLPNGVTIAPQPSSPAEIAEREFGGATGDILGAWRLFEATRIRNAKRRVKKIGDAVRRRRYAAKKFRWDDGREPTKAERGWK